MLRSCCLSRLSSFTPCEVSWTSASEADSISSLAAPALRAAWLLEEHPGSCLSKASSHLGRTLTVLLCKSWLSFSSVRRFFLSFGASPPCSSFSRAVHPPFRSVTHPRGLPHLSPTAFEKVRRGNRQADWTGHALALYREHCRGHFWIEGPDGCLLDSKIFRMLRARTFFDWTSAGLGPSGESALGSG